MRIETVPGRAPPPLDPDLLVKYLLKLSSNPDGAGERTIGIRNNSGHVALVIHCNGAREAQSCGLYLNYLGFTQVPGLTHSERSQYDEVYRRGTPPGEEKDPL